MPPEHDFKELEKKVTDVSNALAHLSSAEDFRSAVEDLYALDLGIGSSPVSLRVFPAR